MSLYLPKGDIRSLSTDDDAAALYTNLFALLCSTAGPAVYAGGNLGPSLILLASDDTLFLLGWAAAADGKSFAARAAAALGTLEEGGWLSDDRYSALFLPLLLEEEGPASSEGVVTRHELEDYCQRLQAQPGCLDPDSLAASLGLVAASPELPEFDNALAMLLRGGALHSPRVPFERVPSPRQPTPLLEAAAGAEPPQLDPTAALRLPHSLVEPDAARREAEIERQLATAPEALLQAVYGETVQALRYAEPRGFEWLALERGARALERHARQRQIEHFRARSGPRGDQESLARRVLREELRPHFRDSQRAYTRVCCALLSDGRDRVLASLRETPRLYGRTKRAVERRPGADFRNVLQAVRLLDEAMRSEDLC